MEEKEYKIAVRALELFFANFAGAKQIDLSALENLPTHKLKELLAAGVM